MPELWDVYDAQRNRKPGSHVRGTPLAPGDFHLVVEIWTFTPDGRVLLTLRHPDKHFGGKWECTGGSVVQGEDSLTGARRELLEETGLSMAGSAPTLLTTLTVPANGTIYDIYTSTPLEDLDKFTSAGALALAHNIPMKVVPTNLINLKITYKHDMDVFRKLFHDYYF